MKTLKRIAKKVLVAVGLRRPDMPYFVSPRALITAPHLEIGDGAHIGDYVVINTTARVRIGKNSQLNYFNVITGEGDVLIGDNVMIAPHVMISSAEHDFVQTEKPMRFAGSFSRGPVVIEDNVWIGANVTITDAVRIGHDAVVGANSVVTHDVAPYDIVVGVPARVLKNRKTMNKTATKQ